MIALYKVVLVEAVASHVLHRQFKQRTVKLGSFGMLDDHCNGAAANCDTFNAKIIIDNEYLADPDSFCIPFYQTRHLFSTDPTVS